MTQVTVNLPRNKEAEFTILNSRVKDLIWILNHNYPKWTSACVVITKKRNTK